MTAQASLQDTAGTRSRALTCASLPALLGLALAAHLVAAAVWIALFPQGSTDVVNFRRAAELVLSGQSPYASPWNVYPPPYFWLLALLLRASGAVPVPFRFLMLTPAMLGDLAIVAWLWHVSRKHLPRARAARLVLLGGALSPPLVIISAVHGQIDSLPTLLAALACWVHGRAGEAGLAASDRLAGWRRWLAGYTGALLGASIALKWFPVMLLPVLLLSARSHRARLAILALSILPAGLALLPYLDGDPGAVLKQVFGYTGGVFPWWGHYAVLALLRRASVLVSGSLSSLLRSALSLDGMYSKWTFLVALLAGWRWLRLGSEPMRGALLTLGLFYVAVANVAPQYSVWGVPFFVAWAAAYRPRQSTTMAARYAGLAFVYLACAEGYIHLQDPGVDHRLVQALWLGMNLAASALWLWWAALIWQVARHDHPLPAA